MDVSFSSGPDDMVTWVASDPGFMQRASHALVADGATWLVDPVDHPDVRARLDSLPAVTGVLQLLDRHGRDCAVMAADLGVPLVLVSDNVSARCVSFFVDERRCVKHVV
jgi:hypothetical protein